MSDDTFKIIIPAQLEKSEDGEWRVHGLASTNGIDKQGETIIQKGIDLSPVDDGRGIINWDHDNSPENIIGVLDGYKQTDNGLYVNGRLFQNHDRAKAVHSIMESLGKGDKGRMGMSVEGKILERDPKNNNIIKKCQIRAVALTMNPVNADTHCAFMKSLNAASIEFDATKENMVKSEESMMPLSQVIKMLEKALGVTGAYASEVPAQLKDGDALAQENLDEKKKRKKIPKDVELNEPEEEKEGMVKSMEPNRRLRRMKKSEYSYNLNHMLGNLQTLYPKYSRTHIWECVKDRLETKYEDLNDLV